MFGGEFYGNHRPPERHIDSRSNHTYTFPKAETTELSLLYFGCIMNFWQDNNAGKTRRQWKKRKTKHPMQLNIGNHCKNSAGLLMMGCFGGHAFIGLLYSRSNLEAHNKQKVLLQLL